MTDEILKRIDLLAAKLGVTAQYLWGVLVKQARIEMWQDIGWVVVFGFLTLLAVAGSVKAFKKASERRYDSEAWGSLMVVCGITGLVTLVVVALGINSAITEGLNPEYWALKQIMEAVGK